MKKTLILTALCLATCFASANDYRDNDSRYKIERQKTIEKTFTVTANPTLEMEGPYSDFIITTWDKPQIDFSVKISVNGDDEKKVEAKFRSIDIEFEKEGNKISAQTEFGDYPYRSFKGDITIRYNVRVPRDVYMDLETKYGDIILDEANHKLEADVQYGDFRAGKLKINSLQNCQVCVKYGDINIDEVNQLYMELAYGDAKINKCDHIDGTLSYSKLFITDMGHGKLKNKYSDTRIEKADKVILSLTDYSNVKVRNLTDMIAADDLRYSDLSVTSTSPSPKIEIDGIYTDVVLYLDENASFNYKLKALYGDITFKGFFNEKNISGQGSYGKDECGYLNITTKYGDVDILKNK